ncbi:MAG: 2-amino-4-hydroxy-6-hydroxymethyldihydropteridine diphosphokinase [Sulfitobacter sp.]|jgi:2-amino-4-hydroxy-6-hydroxymethyldihydropteridine diphosphokinase
MLQGRDHKDKGGNQLILDQVVFIALGSNLASPTGTPAQIILEGLTALEKHGAVIRKTSRLYHTPAFPAGAGPDYVNAAVEIAVPWNAQDTLSVLHRIEAEMGRERLQRWGQRTLDMDMIAFGAAVLPDPQTHLEWREMPLEVQIGCTPDQLILPHPRVQDRAFVLVPLAEIVPDWIHPILGLTVQQMLDALPEADKIAVQPCQ